MHSLLDRFGRRNVTLAALALVAVLLVAGAWLLLARPSGRPPASGLNSTSASRLDPYRGLAT